MPHDPYRGLYIHIPFCVSRCNYCDFHTYASSIPSSEAVRYIESLVMQLRSLAREGELGQIETVYIGGGTPTHLGSALLTQLLYALSLSIRLEKVTEFTVEANPESLNERLVRDMWALGVNRLSIGVQSFNDTELAILGRPHNAEQARQAISAAFERFEKISIDLICGIPGQSTEDFLSSVQEALALRVPHVSIYPLTIEAHTPFERMMREGKLELPSDDNVADMMEGAATLLEDAGLVRYEVANYTRPGFESLHNSSYWQGIPYLGLGESAVTMTQNSEHRMRVQDGEIIDELDLRAMISEDLMLAMRMRQGVGHVQVEQAAQEIPDILNVFNELCALGLVEDDGERFYPTTSGWLCGNELFGRILFAS